MRLRDRATWHRHAIALALALAGFCALRIASPHTGYVRDEAAYIEASRQIQAWLGQIGTDPARALKRRDRAFRYNHEHPAGMKLLAAMVAVGSDDPQIQAQRMRIPAQLMAALGVYLLAIVGIRRYGVAIGSVCALGFLTLPRVFYHAQLHCFDVPIAVASLATAMAFTRWMEAPNRRHVLWLGLAFGASISIKHNAWLLPGLLFGAWLWACRGRPQRGSLPKILVGGAAGVVLGIFLFLLCWPWLWSAPWSRWLEYIAFHREHSYYNMEFLGANYNQPPLPWSYPWLLTAVTWPLSWILLVFAGGVLALRERRSPPEALQARIELTLTLAPMILISLPSVPIFGGTKHWITAYPFMMLLLGRALAALRDACKLRSTDSIRARLGHALVGLVLWSPCAFDCWRSAPNQLAQYASWFGGPRAAARLGLGRAFWGGVCLPEVLGELQSPSRVFPHDAHAKHFAAYASGARANLRQDPGNASHTPEPAPLGADGVAFRAVQRSGAELGLSFVERHFLIDELWTMRAFEQTAPASVCSLDDVPLLSVYTKKPGTTP